MHTDTDTNYSVTITAHTAEAALAAFAGPTPALWVDVAHAIITRGWRDGDDQWCILRDAVTVGVEAARIACAPSRAGVEPARIEYESTGGTTVVAAPAGDGIAVTITGKPGSVLRRARAVLAADRGAPLPEGWHEVHAALAVAAAEADAAYWRAQVEACQTPRPTPTNMDEE